MATLAERLEAVARENGKLHEQLKRLRRENARLLRKLKKSKAPCEATTKR